MSELKLKQLKCLALNNRVKIKELKTEVFKNIELKKIKTKKFKKLVDELDVVKRDLRDNFYEIAEIYNRIKPDKLVGIVTRCGTDDVFFKFNFNGVDCIGSSSVCSDVNSKSLYNETCCIFYVKDQRIEFEIKFSVGDDHIYPVFKKLSGGQVDQDKYSQLCKKTNLAFFKYPDVEGYSGLF